jgi:hypothetical protein
MALNKVITPTLGAALMLLPLQFASSARPAAAVTAAKHNCGHGTSGGVENSFTTKDYDNWSGYEVTSKKKGLFVGVTGDWTSRQLSPIRPVQSTVPIGSG